MGQRIIYTALCAFLLIPFSTPVCAKTPPAQSTSAKKLSDKVPAKVLPRGRSIVASIGDHPVIRDDITYIIQIEHAYGTLPLSETAALMTVMRDVITQQVAQSVGVVISTAEMPTHFPFIDQNTPREKVQDSDAQDALPIDKQIFRVDHAAYGRLYIAPKMLNRKLREFYITASDLHPHQLEQIQQVLQLVLSGQSLHDAARTAGLTTTRREFNERDTETPMKLIENAATESHAPKKSLLDALDQLSPGKIVPNVIEDESGFRIMQLIAKRDADFMVETVEIAKPPFEIWLKERARALNIKINDEQLKNSIKAKYPTIDWVSRL